MKQKLYYAIPFVAVPLLIVLFDQIHNIKPLQLSPLILGAALLLVSAVMGFFSATQKTFDYLLTALMPLSLFVCMFVAGFLSKDDTESQFLLYRAFDVAFQPLALLLYVLMAIVTFLASYKHFRYNKNRAEN